MRGVNYLESKTSEEVIKILSAIKQQDVRYGIFGGRSFSIEGTKVSLNAFLRYSQTNQAIAAKVRSLDASSLEKPDRHFAIRLLHPVWKVLHAVRSFFFGSAREREKLIEAIERKVVFSTPADATSPAAAAAHPADVATPNAASDNIEHIVMSPPKLTRMPTSPKYSGSMVVEDDAESELKLDEGLIVHELEEGKVSDLREVIAKQMLPLPEGSVKYMLFAIDKGLLLYRYERLQSSYRATQGKGHFFAFDAFNIKVLSEYIEGKWGQVVENKDFIE